MAVCSLRIAVLDDYHSLAETYLPPTLFPTLQNPVTVYRDTLPQTTSSELDTLVTRLEPYDVIVTMRERTPFPAALLDRLPNLKVLLTTGTHNRALDIKAASERGVVVAGTPPTTFRCVTGL